MNKKNFLIGFIIVTLFFTIIPNALSYTTLDVAGDPNGVNKTSWDDVPTSSENGISGYVQYDDTTFQTGYFCTSNTADLTTPNSFAIKADSSYAGRGYWNFTQEYEYIKQINFSYYTSGIGTVGKFYMYFYNNGVEQIKIHFDESEDLYWYIGTNPSGTLVCDLSSSNRYYIIITHNFTNNFNIKVLNDTFGEIANKDWAGRDDEDWLTYDSVYLITASAPQTNYIDNYYITYGDAPLNPETVWCAGDTDDYESRGLSTQDKFLETRYYDYTEVGGITGTIQRVELYTEQLQYDGNHNLSKYDLVINGENVGNPSAFTTDDTTNLPYKIVWSDIDKSVVGNEPIFSFGAYEPIGAGGYYWRGFGVDEDWETHGFVYHDSDTYHNNSNYEDDPSLYSVTEGLCDLAYCIYLEDTNIIIPDEDNESEYQDFYFEFRDIETNTLLNFKGYNVDVSEMGSLDYCEMLVFSEKTTNGLVYSKSQEDGRLKVNANFSQGEYVTFNFMGTGNTNFNVRIDNVIYKYKPIERIKQLYTGQTYVIHLYPYDWIDGVEYKYCHSDWIYGESDLKITICINKKTYDYGETLRMKYKLPTAKDMYDSGLSTEGYYLTFLNTEYYLWFWVNHWDYVYRYELESFEFDGNWHTLELPITYYRWSGFKTYYSKYEVQIVKFNNAVGETKILYDSLYFYCSGQEFTPDGNITSISPNPCFMGQPVTFSWTANNSGTLEICYPNGQTYFTVPFGYSDSTHETTKTISAVGSLPVNLYVDTIFEENNTLPVDTDTLVCNPVGDNGTYEGYGYGIPYLYIPVYRGIAGYDTIYIYYRTYKNDSLLEVKSPRYETTFFSTTVSNQSDNVLAIELQAYMQIGSWNVTLYGGDIYDNNITLNSSFNIVNEEGNWIEFSKHTYTTDEQFGVYIKHSYRVALTFYKDNVAQGETIIFQPNEVTNELYLVSLNKVKPSVGSWQVEMWRINDRNQVYELAEWDCKVVKGAYIPPDTGLSISIASIPYFIRIIIGVGITLMVTIIPLIIAMYLHKHRISINIPSLVYVGFFFFGLVVSTVFGFLPIWIIFVVLFGIILTFAITWLTGQKNNKVESEE